MTDKQLLRVLERVPSIEEKYGIHISSGRTFYYNREKTCICFHMGGVDLHCATKVRSRMKGYFKLLFEEFILERIKSYQEVTLIGDKLLNLFMRNGFEVFPNESGHISLSKGDRGAISRDGSGIYVRWK